MSFRSSIPGSPGRAGAAGGNLRMRGAYSGIASYVAGDAVTGADGLQYYIANDYAGPSLSAISPPTAPWIKDAAATAATQAAAARDAVIGAPRLADIGSSAASGVYAPHVMRVVAGIYTSSAADFAAAHEVGTDIAAGYPIDAIGAHLQIGPATTKIRAKIWSRLTSDTGQSSAGPGQVGDTLLDTIELTPAQLGIDSQQSHTEVFFPLSTAIYTVAATTYLVEFDARDIADARTILRVAYITDSGSTQRRRGYYRGNITTSTWSNIATGQRLATVLGKLAYISSASVANSADNLTDVGIIIHGKATAPASQASSSLATAVFVNAMPVERDCQLRYIRAWVRTAGTATVSIFDASGARVSTISFSAPLTGACTFTSADFGMINLRTGHYCSLGGATTGGMQFAYTSGMGFDGGYYQVSVASTSFAPGSPTTNFALEVQYGFIYDDGQVVTAARFLAAEAAATQAAEDAAAVSDATELLNGFSYQIQGRPEGSDPITGSTASTAYILLQNDAVASDCQLTEVTFWAKAPGNYTVLRCTFDGSTRATLASISYTAASTGLTTISAEDLAGLGTFSAGQFGAIYGQVAYVSAPADGGGWYPGGPIGSTSATVGVLSTTIQLQVRFTYTISLGQIVTATALQQLQADLEVAQDTANEALASATPTFAQTLLPGVYKANAIQRRTFAAIKANVRWAIKGGLLVNIGDSTTRGFVGTGADYVGQRELAHPSIIARAFEEDGIPARYDALIGASNSSSATDLQNEFDGRLTMGAGWDVHSLGGGGFGTIGGYYFRAAGITTPLAYVPQKDWKTARVLYAKGSSGGAVFDILINDVVVQTVTATGTVGNYSVMVTAPDIGLHTISVRRTSGGDFYFIGAVFFNPNLPELNVINCGWSGSEPSDWVNGSGYSADVTLDVLVGTDPVHFLCNHGINAWIGSRPVADFKASYQSLINAMTSLGTVWLINPVPSNGYPTQTDYAAAIYELSDENGLPQIDMRKRFVDYPTSAAFGLYSSAPGDKWHPNKPGQWDMGTAIYEALKMA